MKNQEVMQPFISKETKEAPGWPSHFFFIFRRIWKVSRYHHQHHATSSPLALKWLRAASSCFPAMVAIHDRAKDT